MREPRWWPGGAGRAKKSRAGVRVAVLAAVLVGTLVGSWLTPSSALAHTGPANPVASSYLAQLTMAPAGVKARVLGGDLRMWLSVPAPEEVVVLDYRGTPYLRFSRAGVFVNTHSWMYYLNQPIPVTPPAGLTPHTPPHWTQASSSHQYSWHDGRLHALAAVALAPGQRYVGRWTIPLLVGGRRAAISGGLFHADDPSIVWFWPVVVVLLCLWALSRVGRRELDRAIARVLGTGALAGITILSVGHQLYGEPFVTTGQRIVLGLILFFVIGALLALLWRGPGAFSLILIAVGALWASIEFLPVLLHGYVLMVVPAFLARVAAVACLAGGIGLIVELFAFRLVDVPDEARELPLSTPEHGLEDVDAWESLA